MTRLFFESALLPGGWAERVCIDIDDAGEITGIGVGAEPGSVDFSGAVAVPGLPNLHSHAFQRAMSGLAEIRGSGDDSFWTWRQAMYRFLAHLTPDDLRAIATQLYVEMLEAGFTSVGVFHYVHHRPDGAPYDDIGAMAAAIAEAAQTTGIGITFLPVFYANGGFGAAAPTEGQRRFVNDPGRFGRLLERTREIAGDVADAAVGIAPHSLRSTMPESLKQVLALSDNGPIHIHIAEQQKEVEDCVDWCGRRPVEWLLEAHDVDARWCLVHATHMIREECVGLARTGAIAGLCPLTEANLGDGIFDGVTFTEAGGRFGIGSDSHIYISVAEELRLLEYSQRLRDRKRNRLSGKGSTGRTLYDGALVGGAQASGRRLGRLQPGCRADIVSLDAGHPALIGRGGDQWLDGWLFAGDNSIVRDVWVGGRHLVADGRHVGAEAARAAFASSVTRILDA